MSNYGVDSNKIKVAKENMPPLRLSSFIDPRQPWVLVPNGSLLGFFDWIPERLRVGPWKPVAPIIIIAMVGFLIETHPAEFLYESPKTLVSSYEEPYTIHWWYNVLIFTYMTGLTLWILKYRSKGVIVTFTVLSWVTNQISHGINAIAPFLYDHHILLQINRIIRFPALATASATCCIWNFVLLPYICIFLLDTKLKRHNFAKFNFNFRLVQLHVCNVLYAILNTLVTRKNEGDPFQLFDKDDLWYGSLYGVAYGLFYTLVLDRIGVHLYPVFSPRSNLVVVTWFIAFGLYFALHWCYNQLMQSRIIDFATVPLFMGANITISILSMICLRNLTSKDEEIKALDKQSKQN